MLTGTVVLGIVTATRWIGESTPGFVTADLHRNLSLLAIFLLLGHIVTTVLDPYAHIGIRDVVIPFGAAYRPVWLGLGVAAAWVVLAVASSSLLRGRVGPRLWRLIHWAAYAAWPLAMVHGLGAGSDAQSPWLLGVATSCLVAVLFALAFRLREGGPATRPIRVAAGIASLATVVGVGAWAAIGPLQPGWPAKAGTPPVAVVAVTPGPVHPGPAGFSDPLAGIAVRDKTGKFQISMRDMIDVGLTITIRSPGLNETLPVVSVARDGRVLCTVPAAVGTNLYAVCGTTRFTVTFLGSDSVLKTGGPISGRLDTTGPLN